MESNSAKMYGFVLIVPFILAFTDLSGATSEPSEPQDKCDVIFQTMMLIRENVIKNPSLNKIFSKYVELYKSEFENRVGVSVDDEKALRDLACNIADATNLSELSDAINIPERDLKFYLENIDENYIAYEIETTGQDIKEFRKLHKWVKKSGFPDNWPLSVSFDETSKLLKNTPHFGREVVGLGYTWGDSDDEIASLVTSSTITSVYDYVQRLYDFADIIVDSMHLAWARSLGEKTAMNDYIKVAETYQATLHEFINVGLLDLWKK